MNRNLSIELTEYSTLLPTEQSNVGGYRGVETEKRLKQLVLSTEDRELLKILKGKITINELKDGLAISTNSFIGIATFSQFSIVVQPKVLMKTENLFGMINYAYSGGWETFPQFSPETNKNFLIDPIIVTFVKQCEHLVKQGVYKSYVTHQDNISFLRGKLLLRQQLYNAIKNTPKVYCEFDELEYNNIENQIILFCLRRGYSLTKNENLRSRLRLLIMQISSVVEDKFITIGDFTKVSYNRQNVQYGQIHRLCRLILQSSGIVDFYSNRKHMVDGFFVDMNEIFEEFVAKLFIEFYSYKYKVESQKSKKAWIIDDYQSYRNIRTDILLIDKQTRKKIVVDTKYKPNVYDSDLYQIGFYVHEYSLPDNTITKTGLLILPTAYGEMEKQKRVNKSMVQNIQIVQSYLNLDHIIQLLSNKKLNRKIIQDYLTNLLEIPR